MVESLTLLCKVYPCVERLNVLETWIPKPQCVKQLLYVDERFHATINTAFYYQTWLVFFDHYLIQIKSVTLL